MKKTFLFLLTLLFTALVQAQTNGTRFPPLDKSPMDMAYYPANYPVLKIQDKVSEPLVARVIYSRPQKANRTVFGELVEYNTVWRLGANEATEIEFFRDVKIGGKKVPKGKYTMYALVADNNWTLILNKDTDTWGAFKYDAKKDVVRVPLPVQKTEVPVDAFTITFEKGSNDTIHLNIAWDTKMVALPIALK